MLANAAARAISGRGTPAAFRIAWSSPTIRSYASDASAEEILESGKKSPDGQAVLKTDGGAVLEADGKSQQRQPTQPFSKKGPYRVNRVWGPNMRLGTGYPGTEYFQKVRSSNGKASFSSITGFSPRRNYSSERSSKDRPREGIPSEQASEGSNRQASSPSDFHSKLRERSENLSPDNESPGEPTPTQPPTGPLPDLRQGIPSTLNPQSADQASNFKDTDAESQNLNLTADPAGAGGRNYEDGPREEYVSSIERRRNAFVYYMFLAAGIAGGGGVVYLGRNWDNEEEAKAHPEAPNGYTPIGVYNRVSERLRNLFGYYTEPAFEKLLPDPSPDPNLRAPYTLVLSLEDLLVSSKWDRSNGYTVAKRPGVDYFLRYMSQYYELVIFTTVLPMNADGVLRKLDPFRFCIPLFRDATRYMEGEHVKDLSYLNRDLSKTLIIDTVPAHVKLQPENAIVLPKWKGDIKDPHRNDLVALIPFLEYIATMSIEDVRKVLKSYEGTHIPTEFHKRETKAREQFNKVREEEKAKRPKLGGGIAGLSSALGFKPGQGMMSIPGEQTPSEGFAQGKMLSDQMRERGQKAYLEMEKQLRENGETWLKQQEEEEKKMQEEATRNMTGWLPFFGATAQDGSDDGKKKD